MTEYMDNDAGLYMDEVQSEGVLTREQEVALFQRLERGDAEAREEIVRANLRFVVKIAYEFVNRGLPLADLIQEGNVGLLEVIPKYDWRKGFRFSTYAAFWIRQAIQMALRQHASLIRLPVRKSRMLGRLNREVQQLRQELGREPTSYELAERMNTTVEEVERLMMLREGVLSLDAQESEDDAPLLETMAAEEAVSPREIAAEKQIRGKVARVLDYLGERERRIVRLRFGFESGHTMSLRKTSKLVGLSQEGVRRIEQRALGKLRRPALQKMVAGLI